MKGFFLVFEGIEGCGKSTQARALFKRLGREGLPCLLTREPGGTSLGNKLRSLVKQGGSISPEAELFLFNASRVHLVKEVIKPALEEGKIVISDRFYPSTISYQGHGRGMEIEVINSFNRLATGGLKPDMIVLLDLEVEEGLNRKLSSGGDRFEKESADFHQKVRKGYLTMAGEDPGRWFIVDAGMGRRKIATKIFNEVKKRIEA